MCLGMKNKNYIQFTYQKEKFNDMLNLLLITKGKEQHYMYVLIKDFNKFYYALNKILNSDWLNTNLTSDDVWLVRSNVNQPNLISD